MCREWVLLDKILRQEWGFRGMVISDWYGTHSTVQAALAGLDVEMPGNMFLDKPCWIQYETVQFPKRSLTGKWATSFGCALPLTRLRKHPM